MRRTEPFVMRSPRGDYKLVSLNGNGVPSEGKLNHLY